MTILAWSQPDHREIPSTTEFWKIIIIDSLRSFSSESSSHEYVVGRGQDMKIWVAVLPRLGIWYNRSSRLQKRVFSCQITCRYKSRRRDAYKRVDDSAFVMSWRSNRQLVNHGLCRNKARIKPVFEVAVFFHRVTALKDPIWWLNQLQMHHGWWIHTASGYFDCCSAVAKVSGKKCCMSKTDDLWIKKDNAVCRCPENNKRHKA